MRGDVGGTTGEGLKCMDGESPLLCHGLQPIMFWCCVCDSGLQEVQLQGGALCLLAAPCLQRTLCCSATIIVAWCFVW